METFMQVATGCQFKVLIRGSLLLQRLSINLPQLKVTLFLQLTIYHNKRNQRREQVRTRLKSVEVKTFQGITYLQIVFFRFVLSL